MACASCDEKAFELDRLRHERDALALRVQELTRARTMPPPFQPERAHSSTTTLRNTTSITSRAAPSRSSDHERHATGVVVAPGLNNSEQIGAVSPANQGLDFGALQRLDPEELDALPYGLVTLDGEGRVVQYNDTESRLARFPKSSVIGKDFFREVAPCTRVRAFEGRFRELVADPAGVRVQTFDFVFRFDHSEQYVTIVITPARRRGQFHVAMLRRAIVT